MVRFSVIINAVFLIVHMDIFNHVFLQPICGYLRIFEYLTLDFWIKLYVYVAGNP
jgi:hypothetical protein